MFFRYALLVSLMLFLAACNGETIKKSTTDIKLGYIKPTDDKVWVYDDKQTVTHQPTGMKFPLKFAGFKRNRIIDFSKAGDDSGVNYISSRSHVTFYMSYYSGANYRDILSAAASDIVRVKGGKYLSQGVLKPEGNKYGALPEGNMVRFVIKDAKKKEFESSVWLLKRGNWFLKVRMTYPAKEGVYAMAEMQAMLSKEMRQLKSMQGISFSISSNSNKENPELLKIVDLLVAINWPKE